MTTFQPLTDTGSSEIGDGIGTHLQAGCKNSQACSSPKKLRMAESITPVVISLFLHSLY
jgi:hypothetical protein